MSKAMAKVMLLTKDSCDHNRSLMTYLKVMYFFGYLPISWVSDRDPDYFELKFRISNLKAIVMLAMDFILSLLVLAYFYLFYNLNVDANDSLWRIFNPSFYLEMNDDVETTAISQMAYVTILVVGFWTYSYTGYKMLPMNKLLKKPFFHLSILVNFGATILMVVGAMFHVTHISDKMMQKKPVERGSFFNKPFSVSKGWKFYGPIFLTIFPTTRLMLFKFFYESMLLSILKGWSRNRPTITLDETTSFRDWKSLKNEVKEWISFYQDVTDTFSSYLIGAVGLIAPAIILNVYILLTLPMQKHTIEESFKEYIAMLLMLAGFGTNYMIVVNGCHRAYDETGNLRSEIFLARTTDIVDESAEHLLKKRQEMLVSVLAEAKPLNGKGFFNVDRPMIVSIFSVAITYIIILVQFNMAENPPTCPSLPIDTTIS